MRADSTQSTGFFLSGPPSACSRRDGGLKGTLDYKADLAVLSPRQASQGGSLSVAGRSR